MSETEGPPGERPRLRVSAAEMMGWVAWAAVALKWPRYVLPTGPPLAYLMVRRANRALGRAAGQVLLAAYVPTLIVGLLLDCAHCRETWALLWPIVPGAPVWYFIQRGLGWGRLPDGLEFAASGVATLALLVLATWVATRGRWGRVAVPLAVAIGSTVAAEVIAAAVRS